MPTNELLLLVITLLRTPLPAAALNVMIGSGVEDPIMCSPRRVSYRKVEAAWKKGVVAVTRR